MGSTSRIVAVNHMTWGVLVCPWAEQSGTVLASTTTQCWPYLWMAEILTLIIPSWSHFSQVETPQHTCWNISLELNSSAHSTTRLVPAKYNNYWGYTWGCTSLPILNPNTSQPLQNESSCKFGFCHIDDTKSKTFLILSLGGANSESTFDNKYQKFL